VVDEIAYIIGASLEDVMAEDRDGWRKIADEEKK